MMPFLKLEDVSKSYDSVLGPGPPVRVLDGINLAIEQGESAAIYPDLPAPAKAHC